MADIFLSYAREDLETARLIADALESEGWSVFWDRRIPPGHMFDDYIENRLKECRVVVVLWSPDAVKSRWVRSEAAHGLNRTPPALVPVLIATTTIPFRFEDVQAADLTMWRPKTKSIEYDELISAIQLLAPRPTSRLSTNVQTAATAPPVGDCTLQPPVVPQEPKSVPTRGSLTAFKLMKARLALNDGSTFVELEGGRRAAQEVIDTDPTNVEARRLVEQLSQRLKQPPAPARKKPRHARRAEERPAVNQTNETPQIEKDATETKRRRLKLARLIIPVIAVPPAILSMYFGYESVLGGTIVGVILIELFVIPFVEGFIFGGKSQGEDGSHK